MSEVRYAEHGDVAVILIDNPPVNGLGHSVRQGIAEGLSRAAADPSVKAVVLAGAGRMFCGGADIRQFNTPAAALPPMSRQVLRKIEQSGKPVVAAIHGAALGGGLELALGCHYRVVTADARLGLPEVNLGLVPGGGGTQRLPRLLGVRAALDFVRLGKPVRGEQAVASGLADALIEGDVVEAGVAWARTMLGRGGTHRVIGHAPPAGFDGVDFAASKAAVSGRARNALAQRSAIECIEASIRLPFEDGLDFERARFDVLVAGPESKALRHLFFAEREAAKLDGAPSAAGVRGIASVGVLGAGTMGVGARSGGARYRGLAQVGRN